MNKEEIDEQKALNDFIDLSRYISHYIDHKKKAKKPIGFGQIKYMYAKHGITGIALLIDYGAVTEQEVFDAIGIYMFAE